MRQAIILGGGTSVLQGINTELFEKIRNKFTVGLNYSHHFFKSTVLMCVDKIFAKGQQSFLKDFPLVIGTEHVGQTLAHTYHFPTCPEYTRDCQKGIYKSTLVGLFALSFLIYVMDEGEIFLLGYDYGAQKGNGPLNRAYDKSRLPLTHWYQAGDIPSVYTGQPQKIVHKGIGQVNWYEALHRDNTQAKPISRAEHEFEVYRNESKVKIFNVSPDSRIPIFPKIAYEQFYQMLDSQIYDQEALRQEIRSKAVNLIKAQKGSR